MYDNIIKVVVGWLVNAVLFIFGKVLSFMNVTETANTVENLAFIAAIIASILTAYAAYQNARLNKLRRKKLKENEEQNGG